MPGTTYSTAPARAVKQPSETYSPRELFPGENRKDRRDPNRRRRLLTRAQDLVRQHHTTKGKEGISRGARNCLDALIERSDKYGKIVWGHQADWIDRDGNEREGLATLAGCSPRQFQRNLKELEKAGLVEVVRCAPEQMPDGKVRRPKVNRYKFCIPRAKPNRKPRSPQGDTGVTQEPSPTETSDENLSLPAIQIQILDWDEPDQPTEPPPADFKKAKQGIAGCRAWLNRGVIG